MDCVEIEYANKAQPGIFPIFNWHSINFWVDGLAYELGINGTGESIRFVFNRDPLQDDPGALTGTTPGPASDSEAQRALRLLDTLGSYGDQQGLRAGNRYQYSAVFAQLVIWDLGGPANDLVRQLQVMIDEAPESTVGGGWDMIITEEMENALTSLRVLLMARTFSSSPQQEDAHATVPPFISTPRATRASA